MMINDGRVMLVEEQSKDILTQLLILNLFFLPLRNDGTIHITKEKPTQRLESRAVCEQINKQTANETIMVVEQTTGWYVLKASCMNFLFFLELQVFFFVKSLF